MCDASVAMIVFTSVLSLGAAVDMSGSVWTAETDEVSLRMWRTVFLKAAGRLSVSTGTDVGIAPVIADTALAFFVVIASVSLRWSQSMVR